MRAKSIFHMRGHVCTVVLALSILTMVVRPSLAKTFPSFSALTGQPNLTALPGQNVAQQTMAGSINNFARL